MRKINNVKQQRLATACTFHWLRLVWHLNFIPEAANEILLLEDFRRGVLFPAFVDGKKAGVLTQRSMPNDPTKKCTKKFFWRRNRRCFPLKISQVSKNSNIKETLKCLSIIFNPSFRCIWFFWKYHRGCWSANFWSFRIEPGRKFHEIVINVVPEKQTSKFDTALNRSKTHNTLNNFELASQELSKSSEMMFNISALKLGLNSNCSICQETSIVLVGSYHQAWHDAAMPQPWLHMSEIYKETRGLSDGRNSFVGTSLAKYLRMWLSHQLVA